MCLVALCVCLFHQKPARFYPYVSVHVSRFAMRPIATVSHIAWYVYLCIFRYVYALFLLMTHVLWSVCLFVCVLGWFVCLSFPSTIDYYAVDHFYTSLFRFIVGFDPRLPSLTNSIKLYRLTRVVRQIDLLTASLAIFHTIIMKSVRPSVRLSVCPCRSRHHTM